MERMEETPDELFLAEMSILFDDNPVPGNQRTPRTPTREERSPEESSQPQKKLRWVENSSEKKKRKETVSSFFLDPKERSNLQNDANLNPFFKKELQCAQEKGRHPRS